MKKLIMLLVIACFLNNVKAQTAAKSTYVELGGAGLASVNYDMRFMKKNDGLGFRVGIGGFTVADGFSDGRTSLLLFPVGLNYLLGKDDKNFFELGAGATFISLSDTYSGGSDRFTSTFGHLYFGYRLQPKNGGFLFRAGLTPIFAEGSFIPYWAGISFGYKF